MIAQEYLPYIIAGLLMAAFGFVLGQPKMKKQRIPVRVKKNDENRR
ncbi:hypothetical protein M899_1981 [Bacteriovorax sp. BSW11_IV]|nr:hypothetical protein [Bacteriovorax sp. BSW11_IV]EQC46372.1 hypothetical protein M899_1981 [Bacteriovorax sp. BSW11_IV]